MKKNTLKVNSVEVLSKKLEVRKSSEKTSATQARGFYVV